MSPKFKLVTQETINSCDSFSKLLIVIGLSPKGRAITELRQYLENSEFCIDSLYSYKTPTKYNKGTKLCPVCHKSFETPLGHPREKQTCSYACSNTFFRSGKNHGNYKLGPIRREKKQKPSNSNRVHRKICFKHHPYNCIVCGESNIVEVHHLDSINTNNNPENLVPLCSTHHKYMHSRFMILISDKVNEYIKTFKTGLARIDSNN